MDEPSSLAKDGFGKLLIRRIRDPLIAHALAQAQAAGDDGSAAIAAIDEILAEVLHMIEEPSWFEAGAVRSVALRVLVGAPTDGFDARSTGDEIDLAASSDGLVGDLVDWVERFSDFPQTPAFDAVRSIPIDDLEFRRAVRGVIKDLVSGRTTHPALNGIDRLALPPGGAIFPELRESQSQDGRPCWIGAIRLFQASPSGRVPLDRVAWIELRENPDHTIDASLINVLQDVVDRDATGQTGEISGMSID